MNNTPPIVKAEECEAGCLPVEEGMPARAERRA